MIIILIFAVISMAVTGFDPADINRFEAII